MYCNVIKKVAIPQLDDMVAPRFEASSNFRVVSIEKGEIVSTQTVKCDGPEGYRRVRMLQIHGIHVLICNGIKGSYQDILNASGVTVISKISGTIENALERFLGGKLVSEVPTTVPVAEPCLIHHESLTARAREIFKENGYEVSPGPGSDSFLIDLVAEMTCPSCGRPIRVAICCGAHTYRADIEIAEFHHATLSGYNARVYICPMQSSVVESCFEYGIQLIDPDRIAKSSKKTSEDKIPLLHGVVAGHEKASREAGS